MKLLEGIFNITFIDIHISNGYKMNYKINNQVE